MAADRLEIRCDPEIKSKAEKATELLGLKSLTEYVVKLIDRDASNVIENHGSIILNNDIFDRFVEACDKTCEPNEALMGAFNFAHKHGF